MLALNDTITMNGAIEQNSDSDDMSICWASASSHSMSSQSHVANGEPPEKHNKNKDPAKPLTNQHNVNSVNFPDIIASPQAGNRRTKSNLSHQRSVSPLFGRKSVASSRSSDRQCLNILLGKYKRNSSRQSCAASDVCIAVHPAILLNKRSISSLGEIRRKQHADAKVSNRTQTASKQRCSYLNYEPVTDTDWEKRVCDLIQSCSLENENDRRIRMNSRRLGHVVSTPHLTRLLSGPERYFSSKVMYSTNYLR